MEFLTKYKNIVLVVAILIIVVIAYAILSDRNKGEDDLLVSEAVEGISSEVGNGLLTLLLELRSVTLDDNVFESAVFQNLKDFGQELIPEPVGRNNPFAPINIDDNDENLES